MNLAHIKLLGALGLTVGIALLALWNINLRSDVHRIKLERDTAQTDYRLCTSDKKLTEEVSYDYQKNLSALRAQYDSLKRVRDNPRCIPVTRVPGPTHGAAQG